tara:strand:+ start:4326 stop:5255 length:930 start_codon:yes stop_codon:yes gene_type:complete
MNFIKPQFWDKNKITFYSILLLPVSLFIKLLFLLKKYTTKSHAFSIPIICVGNIYLGGTGKTPFSIELYSILKNLNMKPAFVRKKYKSFQDEIDLLKQSGPIYQSNKRIGAIKDSINNNTNIVILDDGFQDFSIKKKLSIICFNEKQWIGNGLTIPSGPLRESLSALKRANFVVINGKKNIDIENKIFSENNKIKIFYFEYKPQNIKQFEGKNVTAFAGIGNPENFFDLLKANKINVINTIKFSDHHKYTEKELENLINDVKKNNNILLTTEKDYFRISERYKQNIQCLKIKIEIENKKKLIEEIKKII